MMRLIVDVHGHYTATPLFTWRAITCAQIYKEVLGMVIGELHQRPCECKEHVLTNELLQIIT